MQVKVLEEHGYENAIRGMAYSFRDSAIDVDEWWANQKERATKRASLLAPMEGGHNKFLESIQVWFDLNACRAFFSEFDTYRVGMTKNSESTMHKLAKRPPTVADFEEGTHPAIINTFIQVWGDTKHDINLLKLNLPEGFLQRRMVCTNYKVLRNIIQQRQGHRFKYWDQFISDILSQVEHPELLAIDKENK